MNESGQFTEHAVAVFPTHLQAEAAVKALNASGYPMNNLSIIGQNYETEEQPVGFINTGDRMISWGKFGAFWGGMWGLLFGSAMMLVPGIGGVLFAGYIISGLEGALLGGTLGVLGGALSNLGIPKNSIVDYESALRGGQYLLMAHGSDAQVNEAKEILKHTDATRIDSFSSDKKKSIALL